MKVRLPKLEKLDVYEVMAIASKTRASDIILMTKLLVSTVGKQKATEMIKKARQNLFCISGNERAKILGNPKDFDTYFSDTLVEQNTMPSWVVQLEIVEKTDKSAIVRANSCYIAQAIRADPEVDPETIDVIIKGYCRHDEAFAYGFNSRLKMINTRNAIDDPEEICEFKVELEDLENRK